MLLTQTNIIHYLLGIKLANAENFVSGEFSCYSSSGRHQHFIVNKEGRENPLFIKQAKHATAEKKASLHKEAFFYRTVATSPGFAGLMNYIPALLHYDDENAVMAVEYFPRAPDLHSLFLQPEVMAGTEDCAAELAAALFTLHSTAVPGDMFFAEEKPWILSLHEWGNAGGPVRSAAEQQALSLIFSIDGFAGLIEKAAQSWQPSCIIHGDCKLSNFLWTGDNNEGGLKWIDWELVSAGDPLWDVATVFQSALSAWALGSDELFSKTNSSTAGHLQAQKFISLVWDKYAARSSYNEEEATSRLYKCVNFTALRLLHSCFETTPAAENLQPYSARLLQLAHNIMLDPAGASSQLLGIKNSHSD